MNLLQNGNVMQPRQIAKISSNEAIRAFGFRKAQAQCADQLRQLIKLLGEDDVFDGRAMMAKGL